jgi:hypothetical protein
MLQFSSKFHETTIPGNLNSEATSTVKQHIIKFGYIQKYIHTYTHNKHIPKTLTAQQKIMDYMRKEETEQENEIKKDQFPDSSSTLAHIQSY